MSTTTAAAPTASNADHDDTFDALGAIWDDADFDNITESASSTTDTTAALLTSSSNVAVPSATTSLFESTCADLFSQDPELDFLPTPSVVSATTTLPIADSVVPSWSTFLDSSCPFRRRVKSSTTSNNYYCSPALSGKRMYRPDHINTTTTTPPPSRKRSRTLSLSSPPFSLSLSLDTNTNNNTAPLVPRRTRVSTALVSDIPLSPKQAADGYNNNYYDVLPTTSTTKKEDPIMEELSSSSSEDDDEDNTKILFDNNNNEEVYDDDVPLTQLKKGVAEKNKYPVMLDATHGVPVIMDDNSGNNDGYITPSLSGRLVSILLMSASSTAFSALSATHNNNASLYNNTNKNNNNNKRTNNNNNSNYSKQKNFAPIHRHLSSPSSLPCVSSAVAAVTMAARNYSRSLAMK